MPGQIKSFKKATKNKLNFACKNCKNPSESQGTVFNHKTWHDTE